MKDKAIYIPTESDLAFIFQDMGVLKLEEIKADFWKTVGYPGGVGLPKNWLKHKGFEGDEAIIDSVPAGSEGRDQTLRHKARLCTYHRIAEKMKLEFDHPVFDRISERQKAMP